MRQPEVKDAHASIIADIDDKGLVYPVTAIEGDILSDGYISLPFILRAVEPLVATPAGS